MLFHASLRFNNRRNIACYNVAAGETEQQAFYSDKRSDDQNSVVLGFGAIAVPMRTLDGLLSDDHQITLLKIDTEGYEKNVLAGGIKALLRTQAVYFEISIENYAKYGASALEVISMLEDFGFIVYRFRNGDKLELIDPRDFQIACENVLAIRPESELAAQRCQTLIDEQRLDGAAI